MSGVSKYAVVSDGNGANEAEMDRDAILRLIERERQLSKQLQVILKAMGIQLPQGTTTATTAATATAAATLATTTTTTTTTTPLLAASAASSARVSNLPMEQELALAGVLEDLFRTSNHLSLAVEALVRTFLRRQSSDDSPHSENFRLLTKAFKATLLSRTDLFAISHIDQRDVYWMYLRK